MRVILTGGITGGHIYPALAIADQFKEIDRDAEFLYLGSDEGMERYIVPKYGYDLKYIDSRWFEAVLLSSLRHFSKMNGERDRRLT